VRQSLIKRSVTRAEGHKGPRKYVYTLTSLKQEPLANHNQSESKQGDLVEKSIDGEVQRAMLRDIELTRGMMVYQNYIEQFTYLIIQFGNVAMFSSNFQLVPTIILVSNWINIESTVLAYVQFVKRPIAGPKKGIGLWNDILLVVGYIATVINCLTIYTANQDQMTNLIGEGETEEYVEQFIHIPPDRHKCAISFCSSPQSMWSSASSSSSRASSPMSRTGSRMPRSARSIVRINGRRT
jgi:hypothetical protein